MKTTFVSVLGGLLALVATTATANTVQFAGASPILAAEGDPALSLTLEGVGFAATDGGAFTVNWDPTVLQYVSTTVYDPPWDTSFVNDTNAAVGVVDYVFLGNSDIGGVSGNFNIVDLVFSVVGTAGDSDIIGLADSAFGGWTDATNPLSELAVTYNPGNVTVVPLPPAVLLFVSAVLGLGVIARRGKSG